MTYKMDRSWPRRTKKEKHSSGEKNSQSGSKRPWGLRWKERRKCWWGLEYSEWPGGTFK